MADTLKSILSRPLVVRLAETIRAVHPKFATDAFVRDACQGLDALELLARGRHISDALGKHLPPRYEDAIDVLLRSLGAERPPNSFFYLPHTIFVATRGLDAFDVSMRAQYELTQRFTCEFSIRPFLEVHPEETLRILRRWAKDPNEHVRRLVSEGTRPRLPWASRVRWIEAEPERVLPLLELLKDDPSSYVRRSVANHLNDLSKGQPDLAYATAKRWLEGGDDARRALISHALRSSVKKGDLRALALLGFGAKPRIAIENVVCAPTKVAIGDKTRITFDVRSTAAKAQSLAVDLVVHFVKANGKPSPKVFKVAVLALGKGQIAKVSKVISLAVHTTRKPYPGKHPLEALVNGERTAIGAFSVVPQKKF